MNNKKDLFMYNYQGDNHTFLFLFEQKMDKNKDGVVTIDEFIESCQKVSVKTPLKRQTPISWLVLS